MSDKAVNEDKIYPKPPKKPTELPKDPKTGKPILHD